MISLVSWVHVFGIYLPVVWFVIVGVIVLQLATAMYEMRFDLQVKFLAIYAYYHL